MLRPWEIAAAAGARPWEQGEAVYPRTISIYRLPARAGGSGGAAGPLPYQESQARNGNPVWQTTALFTSIPCSIQEETRGKESATALPGSQLIPLWRIYIPFAALAKGSLLVHDYLLDDLGVKYQISSPYWDSLGYRAFAIIEES